ncbi:hypothetical protein B2J86_13555 [Acidovorax sp. SRB_14]|uniref:phosphatase PAP2 family protein n=1 Tax=unclassified Acidovorax TaxID=2684926 RepID=UPI00145F9086|nr:MULTISPECIES: phosphatase PAP2 family protein [unclassified Acidovorax]NMM77217.1 hypothetical protein [Acidovorax sp. SRB_24]NMM81937.1 hypothetical protein [Acidovorax sp. SRB_14]NMM89475.1 hypothetical protein [Rhodococcus sp. SRB_17]
MLPLDLAIFQTLNAGLDTPAGVVTLARWVSQVGPAAIGALIAASLVGKQHRGPPWRTLIVCLMALLLTWCAVRGIRDWFPVSRPAQLGLGFQWIKQGARPGFPSMHAATSFALAQGLLLCSQRALGWTAWLVAGAVAWSRVCLGVHFPSDVLAGLLVGTAIASLVALAARAGGAAAVSWRGRFSAYWSHPARPWAPRM